MNYHIEHAKFKYDQITVTGWLIGDTADSVTSVWAENARGVRIPCTVERTEREDVGRSFFPQETECLFGFRIRFVACDGQKYFLCFSDGRKTCKCKTDAAQIRKYHRIPDDFKDALKLQMKGPEQTRKPHRRILSVKAAEKASRERAAVLAAAQVKFSFVIPAYNTEPEHLADMLESIWQQTYGNWEICLADGSPKSMLEKFQQIGSTGKGDSVGIGAWSSDRDEQNTMGSESSVSVRLAQTLVQYLTDPRVKYIHLSENLGISGNTNAAFELAEGDFVVMVDHDDVLTEDALEEIVAVLADHPQADFIYSDSDLTDHDNLYDYNPLLKPRWSQETLYSANYITHLSVVRTSLLRDIGGWKAEYDGAQDWDLFLRIGEKTTEIYHIPWVLYHWRAAASSTARDVGTKPYARLAQLRAVQDHLDRRGVPGRAAFVDKDSTCIRIEWEQGSGGQTAPMGDVLIRKAVGVELSQEAAAELRAWASLPGMGVISPRVMSKGRIVSQGNYLTHGGVGGMCSGWTPGMASTSGHSDWYYDHVAPEPICYAISRSLWEELGGIDESLGDLAVIDLCLRAEKAGYRNMSTPFAQIVSDEESLAARLIRRDLSDYIKLYKKYYPTFEEEPT